MLWLPTMWLKLCFLVLIALLLSHQNCFAKIEDDLSNTVANVTTKSESLMGSNSCSDGVCTCDNNGPCANDKGTANKPLQQYTCTNNGYCDCGYTNLCICDGNNGACYGQVSLNTFLGTPTSFDYYLLHLVAY